MPLWPPGTRFRPGTFSVSVAPTQNYSIQNIVAFYEVVLSDDRVVQFSEVVTPEQIADLAGLIAQAGAAIMQKIMIETEGLQELWMPTAKPTDSGHVIDEAQVFEMEVENASVADEAEVTEL